MDESSEIALYQAWCAGDRQAGAQLLERFFLEVRRFFVNKSNDDIDDLVQSTFLRLLEARDRFEQRSSFRAFVFGVARYVLFEHYRKRRRSRERELDFSVSSIYSLDDSPSQIVARGVQQTMLLAGLRRIPVNMQVALELYYWEDLTRRELAAVLEVPESTIANRLHRGRRALAEALEGLGAQGNTMLDLSALKTVVS